MGPRPPLRGRRRECEALARLLDGVRAGRGSVLVLRGEAGCGKSALMDYVAERAEGYRTLRVAGTESEMELAFAGLHQLCAPIAARMARLPAPQEGALKIAFGLSDGDAPDRFLVGLAVLGLVAEAAGEQPLLCLVDDAQWIDEASLLALALVARRLVAEPVALIFAVRLPGADPDLIGLPDLVVGGLDDVDARLLLMSAIPGRLDPLVQDRILAEAHGNPLALIELAQGLAPADLAGGFGLPDARPLATRIEHSFLRRFRLLPRETQRLLLTSAAEPTGDVALLWRAAEDLGIRTGAAAAAEAAGLFELGARASFRHPLVRSAIYRAASPGERQAVHRALADATDSEIDPDRRAWHQAHAALGPDEAVAEELERSARRAQARGGAAAAAAFLERATELTPELARRGARALAAARAMCEAGAPARAHELLMTADTCPLDDLQRAGLERLRAELAFTQTRGNEAPALLLDAARRLESLDTALARETYLEALSAAQFAGRLGSGGAIQEAAEAAGAAPPSARPRRAHDLLLDGLATRFTQGYAAGVPSLKRALGAFRGQDLSPEEGLRWLWLAGTTAADLWEDETWEMLAARHVEIARDAGALTVLPLALTSRIAVHTFAGELGAAASLIEEVAAVVDATGNQLAPYGALLLAAWRGREAEASRLIEITINEVVPRGEGIGVTVAQWAKSLLYNSLGRYEEALVAADVASEGQQEMAAPAWALVEVIAAATRTRNTDRAGHAFEQLAQRTRASDTDWALGTLTGSRALLSARDSAEDLYREAIYRLGRTRIRAHLARAHLHYGEWLRREGRRLDARVQLRIAHELFTTMGAEAFAMRAARELLATGEHARKRTAEASAQLTAQEAQVARLARDHLTNPEIGAQLFISSRTVEWHLGSVFAKLAISSRKELRDAVPNL